jgi:RNA polymerase sigma factor (sigma-70 family)
MVRSITVAPKNITGTQWQNDRSVPEPKAWLLRTLRNLLIDTYRHNKVRALPESHCYPADCEEEFTLDDFSSEWLEADPQAQMRKVDMRAVVELALDGLTPPNREALLLQYRDELSTEEMAAAWGVGLQHE